MTYPTLADAIALELRQAMEATFPNWRHSSKPLMESVRPANEQPRGKQPPPSLYTYAASAYTRRDRVYVGTRYLGDVVAFPTGYRAYLPSDERCGGLFADRESAAKALWEERE